MYFKRKIDILLNEWLKKEDKTPLLIVGTRQCSKTKSIREFAKANNLDFVELNFWLHPDYCSDFEKSLDVDTLLSNISIRFKNKNFNPKTTLIFFDEIQDCPKARLSFKSFKDDGRFMVIGSGSYLGINGYIIEDTTPVPVGYEEIINMKTMDFEEFLWALGYKQEHIDKLLNYFETKTPIPENIDGIFKDLFIKYACVSGFPEAVLKYLETKKLLKHIKYLIK